jgi:hypothetical protein
MESDLQAYKQVISRLKERAKELSCIYNVEELLMEEQESLEMVFQKLLNIIPPGWQHSTICEARIIYQGKEYKSDDFVETQWIQTANLVVDNHIEGRIDVVYTQFIKNFNGSQFIPEEQKLLNTIADRLSSCIFHRKLKRSVEYLRESVRKPVQIDDVDGFLSVQSDEHWRWRLKMVQSMADKMDLVKLGVIGIYLIGSTRNGTAGPASDIDLLIHIEGDPVKREILSAWIDGWSKCLAEINFLRTGYQNPSGLIDMHLVTNEDIKNKTSFAVMIGATTNWARPVKLREG